MAGKKKKSSKAVAAAPRRFCAIRVGTARSFSPAVGGERARLIRMNADKWVNGTTLRYAFFPNSGSFKPWAGTETLKQLVRKAFAKWAGLGIGLKFQEVADRAQSDVRIGFLGDDGHWSYVGRQVLLEGKDDRTMNLDPLDGIATGAHGIDVACHEIGHTLGFPHEHQNPNAGIVWDEEAVYRDLGGPPNFWDRDKTFSNIIRKIAPDSVQGSSWDPDSIMHYPFAAGLIKEPARYHTGLNPKGGISARDAQWVKTFYPPAAQNSDIELPLLKSAILWLSAGQQKNYVLRPKVTRYYDIQTFGTSDTVGVLNLRENGSERYLAGDDDSGEDRNMHIRRRLQAGFTYVLRLRLYYAASQGETAVMWW